MADTAKIVERGGGWAIEVEIGGKVVAVLVEAGQPVKAGQPLVRLDDALLLVQRAQAAAQHRLFTEQIRFGLFLERRLQHAGARGAGER